MERLIGIAGILVLLCIALAMSNNRKAISWQLVTWGLGIQILFAIIILKTPVGVPFFGAIDMGYRICSVSPMLAVISYSNLFGMAL